MLNTWPFSANSQVTCLFSLLANSPRVGLHFCTFLSWVFLQSPGKKSKPFDCRNLPMMLFKSWISFHCFQLLHFLLIFISYVMRIISSDLFLFSCLGVINGSTSHCCKFFCIRIWINVSICWWHVTVSGQKVQLAFVGRGISQCFF